MKKSDIIAHMERLALRGYAAMTGMEELPFIKPLEIYRRYQQIRGIMEMWNETHKSRITELDMTRKHAEMMIEIRDYLKKEGYLL